MIELFGRFVEGFPVSECLLCAFSAFQSMKGSGCAMSWLFQEVSSRAGAEHVKFIAF